MDSRQFCVILAGGKGRRLWPSSRENTPKQFLDFFGIGRTALQQTFDRFAVLVPKENILVSTNKAYEGLVRGQLPELPSGNILPEPVSRGTAPAAAWACERIAAACQEATVVITPADHLVHGDAAFDADIRQAMDFAAADNALIALGIRPTRPEPGYGYIQMGDDTTAEGISRVRSFSEKPDRALASELIATGEFLWNASLFAGSVSVLQGLFAGVFADCLPTADYVPGGPSGGGAGSYAPIERYYDMLPMMSIDHAILETGADVFVRQCGFLWADLGTWHSIYECMHKSDTDNVVISGRVVSDGSYNNIVKLPADKVAVISGLDGYIISEEDNVLLICKKEDSSALIRKYEGSVRLNFGEEYV